MRNLALLGLILTQCGVSMTLGANPADPVAAPAAATVAAHPPVSPLKPIQFIEYDLPNGLHVILHENHAVPVVSTYVLYHVGSKNERPDRTGFAHFFEHLMFEGSDNIPRGTIDKLVSGAGGNLNASTSFDQTDYYFNLPSNQLKLALWIESERMMHAKIDEKGVETQREVVKEEKRRGVDNQPYGTLFEELAKMVFKGTPYEWVPIGSFQYIDQAKIEEFRQFWTTYYMPNNAVLAIAGDFQVDETKKLIEQFFGDIPRGQPPTRPVVKWNIQAQRQVRDVAKDNTPLPATLHAWRIPDQTHPDVYALQMLTDILSKGRSSRLYRRMVDKERIAMDVEAFSFPQESAGLVGVFSTGLNGVALETLDRIIEQEVESVKKDGVTEDELQKAKNQVESKFASAFGSMNERASNLAQYFLFHKDTNLINSELQRYMAVTRADLQRVAREYLRLDRSQILRYPAATPPQTAKADAAAKPVDRTKKPEPGPAPAASFPPYATRELANGLKVFVIEDDRKPAVTFRLIFRSGSASDDKLGTAAFTASLLNRGTKKRDYATFTKEIDYVGARLEASAGVDAISVGAGSLTKYTDQLLDLMADAVLRPAFPEDQFRKEQQRALSKLAADKQEPDALARKMTAKVLYGSHPYGNVSTEETVKALSQADLIEFHKTWFVPNNATLAVVGDVKADAIIPLIEKAFAGWEAGKLPAVKMAAVQPLPKGRNIYLVDRPGSVQSAFSVLRSGPARSVDEVPELNVLNATLGGGFSGRLFQNLREKNAWTYGAYSAFQMNRWGGGFQAEAEVRNDVTGKAISETLKEMQRMVTEPVPEAELTLQREYNVGNYLLSLENPSRTAQRVQDIDLYGLNPDFYKSYARRMSETTAAAVQKLAAQYLDTTDVSIVVVGEAKQIRPELEKLGQVTVYDTDLKPVSEAPKP